MKYYIFLLLLCSGCGIVKCNLTTKETTFNNNTNTTRLCIECSTNIDSLRKAVIRLQK